MVITDLINLSENLTAVHQALSEINKYRSNTPVLSRIQKHGSKIHVFSGIKHMGQTYRFLEEAKTRVKDIGSI